MFGRKKKQNRKRDEPHRAGATSASRRNSSGNTQSDLRIEWNEERRRTKEVKKRNEKKKSTEKESWVEGKWSRRRLVVYPYTCVYILTNKPIEPNKN